MSRSERVVAYDKIKLLREQRHLSQIDVAEHIGLSRPTYALVEQGEKELTINQLYSLAKVLGVDANDLLLSSKFSSSLSEKTGDYTKFKEMIIECIKNGGSKGDGKITKTKLAKLVYLADFVWYYKHLVPMSGVQYRRLPQGPVPDEYFRALDELFDNQTIAIEPKGSALMISLIEDSQTRVLTSSEKQLIQDICEAWRDRQTKDIVDFTHNQSPWNSSEPGSLIPFDSILSQSAATLY